MIKNISHTELYNDAYRQFTPNFINADNLKEIDEYLQQNNSSLISFITKYYGQFGGMESLYDKSILELGCGLGGLSQYLWQFSQDIEAIDFSSLAISSAKEINQLKDTQIEFHQFDLTQDNKLNKKFDLIIDSHLYHCLVTPNQREAYLNFVKNHLANEGKFLMETMTYNKQMQEPIGYDLTQDYILYKDIENQKTPVRKVAPSLEIENEILNNGFSINYFYVHNELGFNVFPEFHTYPEFRLPRTIRLCATHKA